MVPVNYLAVLLAAIASMPLGFLWYGPLFGKPWMKMMGITPEKAKEMKKKNMTKEYVMMFVGSLLMAFVLSHALIFAKAYLHETGISAGLQTGFWNWIGFVAPVTIGAVLWENKPWKLWILNTGYFLVLLLIQGIILSLM